MYRIYLSQEINPYEIEELIKVFLKHDEYQLFGKMEQSVGNQIADDLENQAVPGVNNHDDQDKKDVLIVVPMFELLENDLLAERKQKNQIKRFLYETLATHTGKRPDWGILTGVRPVKLAREILERESNDFSKMESVLSEEYLLQDEKKKLIKQIVSCQKNLLQGSKPSAVGLYIGIPFCPTRCIYCSFPSNQANEQQIEAYLAALHQEIQYSAENMKRMGWYPETIYVGGGTPTTLKPKELDGLLTRIHDCFDLKKMREFTVEAGRPDTISEEKLMVIQDHGVQRISINPQSMNSDTLKRIGRKHEPEEIIDAFLMARKVGIQMINTDVIAGLPEENEADFAHTLDTVLELSPENVTVHTLAVKRASKLKEMDEEYHYKQGSIVRNMLDIAKEKLDNNGYYPYYLYRQKHMTGNFENVGYAKGDTAGVYNIRIMEEAQTIVALGAGGISKRFYPSENRLERIANVSNYEIYIERIAEMLKRKEENLFI